MKKRLLLLLGMTLFLCQAINAQSWQWGKRGGSSDAGPNAPDETVVDMATDAHGNIYLLSKVQQTGLNVEGNAITTYGNFDVLVTSFKCDGTYRWSKDIGTNSLDLGVAIKADTVGGVYVTANSDIYYTDLNIDTDTLVHGAAANKQILLVKFDTAGNYKWLRMPQPDTTSVFAATTRPLDLDVDGGGNVYWMCALPPGAYADGSYVVTAKGVYILKYDKYGNFISGSQMQISYSAIGVGGLSMKRDQIGGRYYVTGNVGVSGLVNGLFFGSNSITNSIFLGCFNSSGTLLWQKQNTENTANPTSRVAIDAGQYIYMSSISNGADTFNSYYITNSGPVVFKLDTNGNNIWAKNAMTNAATFCSSITVTGTEADIAGQYPGLLKWPGYADSLSLSSGSGYHIFITRFNSATGTVLGMDSLASSAGDDNYSTAILSDGFGSFYVGGGFEYTINVAGASLTSAGGKTDFFVAKYGYSNCSNAGALEAPPGLPQGEEMEVRVYPNPATDELNIEHAGVGSAIRLLNMVGQQVYSAVVSNDKEVINMGHLVTGTYLLQITQADGNRVVRTLVKE